jgi:hypothetical protein
VPLLAVAFLLSCAAPIACWKPVVVNNQDQGAVEITATYTSETPINIPLDNSEKNTDSKNPVDNSIRTVEPTSTPAVSPPDILPTATAVPTQAASGWRPCASVSGDTVCARAGGVENGADRCENLVGYWRGVRYENIIADWNFAQFTDKEGNSIRVPKEEVKLCSEEANQAWGWGSQYSDK